MDKQLVEDIQNTRLLIARVDNWAKYTLSYMKGPIPCWCLLGAIAEVISRNPSGVELSSASMHDQQRRYNNVLTTLRNTQTLLAFSERMRGAYHLNAWNDSDVISSFNDMPYTRHSDVISLLDEALEPHYVEA